MLSFTRFTGRAETAHDASLDQKSRERTLPQMSYIWEHLPWLTISPAVVAALGLWRRIAPTRNEQPSKRGLGLVRLITVLTRDEERRRAGLELARLALDDLTGTTSYVDPPQPSVPPPREP
ncbi:MAG: hypothetical protein ACREP9_15405 [Candidatus Dormibacteraceae bacterium]